MAIIGVGSSRHLARKELPDQSGVSSSTTNGNPLSATAVCQQDGTMASLFALDLHPDRLLPPDPGVRAVARDLYDTVAELPIISPHGHVPAQWSGRVRVRIP